MFIAHLISAIFGTLAVVMLAHEISATGVFTVNERKDREPGELVFKVIIFGAFAISGIAGLFSV